MTETAVRLVKIQLAQRRWSQARLAREAGVDPATVGDFISGKRWPIGPTLAKIEAALGLTPGTLAGLGEDTPSAPAASRATPTLRDASDEELLAELGYRMVQLRREAEHRAGSDSVGSAGVPASGSDLVVSGGAPGDPVAAAGDPAPVGGRAPAGDTTPPPPARPLSMRDYKRARMLNQAQPADQAADDRQRDGREGE